MTKNRRIEQTARLIWLPLAIALAFAVASPLYAQEEPEATPQEAGPTIRLDLPEPLVPEGEEFVVEVLAEDVTGLAGFDITIEYDSERLSYVSMEDTDEFLSSGGRQNSSCEVINVTDGAVRAMIVRCDTDNPPVCLGGPAGATGSGLLARLTFKADGLGETVLELTNTTLTGDDVEPCDADTGVAVDIPHSSESANVLVFGPSRQVQESPARIRMVGPDGSVGAGDEVEVQVLVADVEYLAAFNLTIAYDPELMSFRRAEDVGEFLASGERSDMICADPMDRENQVILTCTTANQAVCIGGPPGPVGSGLLARLVFVAEGGDISLELTEAGLFLDDVTPCRPDADVPEIPLTLENTTVELKGKSGFPWLIVGPIIGAVVVLVGGGAWYLRYGRREPGSTPE